MSLRASSRSDSKLVIYGAGGLASTSKESVQMPPNHHTLKLESNDTKLDQLGTTPPSRGSGASPPPRSMGATPPLRGSVADVEHKSVSSLLKGHAPHNSSPLHHRHTSGATYNSSNRKSSNTNVGEGERRRSYVQEVGSPVKSLVLIDREEQGRHGNRSSSLRQSTSQGVLPQSPYDYNQPPPKVEWYHNDILKSPSHEGEKKSQLWYMDDTKSPGHSQHESNRASYHELGRGRADSVQSQPAYDQTSSSRHHYQRHNSIEHNYRHSSSVEGFQHQASASAGSSGNNMKRFYHSQSVDRIESRGMGDSRETRQRHPHHHHHHHHHHRRHHHSGGRTRSTRSSSDLTETQNSKSSSLTRDTPPRLQEEDEPEGQSSLRYVDSNHPAKPRNRGQYRLSLPESSYYDNGNRPINRHSNARRSRKALSNTGFTSTGSLSQPADLGLVSLISRKSHEKNCLPLSKDCC